MSAKSSATEHDTIWNVCIPDTSEENPEHELEWPEAAGQTLEAAPSLLGQVVQLALKKAELKRGSELCFMYG